MNRRLADIACAQAARFFHGCVMGADSNIDELVSHFPTLSKAEADGSWCAAFVYHCCALAGHGIPIRPTGSGKYHLAACIAWEDWALADDRVAFLPAGECVTPEIGDIVLFDGVFDGSAHDHIGIVVDARPGRLTTAEGNFGNVSAVVERPIDEHIRAYIRIPRDFVY